MKKLMLIFGLALCFYDCAWDEADPVSSACEDLDINYSDVAQIITTKCSQSGCHDGASGQGNYRSYNGVLGVLNNGEFNRRVFIRRDMPEPGSPPLTEEESQMLRCWLEKGHPNN